jgi:hypothetical protein
MVAGRTHHMSGIDYLVLRDNMTDMMDLSFVFVLLLLSRNAFISSAVLCGLFVTVLEISDEQGGHIIRFSSILLSSVFENGFCCSY